jgi:hypothetical protein
MGRRWWILAAVVTVVVLAGCDDVNTVERASTPVVLSGAEVGGLIGEDPDDIVAFSHNRFRESDVWRQIPVQVDERKVVGFGSQPSNNTTAGVTGTVYGSGSAGVTALQYADPTTFVGSDGDAAFDADDEVVFMVEDGGGKPRPNELSEPTGVVSGSGVQVQIDDPLGDDDTAWVYLFVAEDPLDPAAGVDYVDYDFALDSGDYKTTYLRSSGPNPESSSATTDTYTVEFTDRWFESVWRIDAGGGSGPDILDGNKNQFALDFCGRSNVTFADGEGAFVANIDGPVRAIRSYVGANSGPLTQRTHLLYRDHEVIETDLRVHAIPAVMDYLDYSDAALGMSYLSSEVPDGVTIDRVPDAVGTALPDWELVTGAPGSVMVALDHDTDIPTPGGFDNAVDWFYRDEADPDAEQCWGDAHHTGAHGSWVVDAIPNTDPRSAPFNSLAVRRTVRFAGPGATADDAATWRTQLDTPLTLTLSGYGVP